MRIIKHFTVTSAVVVITLTCVYMRASAQRQTRPLELQGEVKDQQGAVIVGAKARLTNERGLAHETISNEEGRFRFVGLSSGSYKLSIIAQGFNAYEEMQEIHEGSSIAALTRLSITLYPGEIKETVTVDNSSVNNLDGARAAGTQVLTEREIEALPDDPDQLNEQLRLLSASGGGAPGDAVVTVDGFRSGGRLPSKASIRQVRINPNLYSAEYDTPPFRGGRIEVTTKPGADALNGSVFLNYNGTALNARDPFAATRAQSETRRYGFQFGAPIVKNRAGYFLDFEKRDINESAIVSAIVLDGDIRPAIFTFNAPTPKRLLVGSARADWQINQNHTIVFRYDLNSNRLRGEGIGGTNLPERGFDSRQTENSFRLTETAVLSPRAVNELRVGFTYNRIEQSAVSDRPAVIVAGSFASGGAGLQRLSRSERRLEISDHLTLNAGTHGLKFGVQIFNRRTSEIRAENTNGTLFFGGTAITNGANTEQLSSLEQYRRALLSLPGGAPTRFSITLGAPSVSVNQWLLAGFVQDEWKVNPKLLLSLGLRYEAQTAPSDPISLAPRVGVAYTPDKKQNWVFRARAGVYYERFEESLILETERLDGLRQQQIIIDAPSFSNPFPSATGLSAIPTIRIIDTRLNPPASLQMRLETERQLPRGWRMSASYSWTYGWSRLRSRNINAPVVTSTNPDPRTALRPRGVTEDILQFESSGRLAGRVLYLGVNQNSHKLFSLNFGYINFDFRTDADNAFALPQSSYDFAGEWARPVWQIRHRVFLTTTVNLPHKLRLSASFNVASGAPFNITTGRDNNGDGNFNDRPGESSATDAPAIETRFGFLNPNVVNGGLRRNAGTNPSIATLDLNLSRAFLIGKRNSKGEGRYKLTINARAANALNRSNLFGAVGILSSPLFGRATLSNPARRIEFGLRFNF